MVSVVQLLAIIMLVVQFFRKVRDLERRAMDKEETQLPLGFGRGKKRKRGEEDFENRMSRVRYVPNPRLFDLSQLEAQVTNPEDLIPVHHPLLFHSDISWDHADDPHVSDSMSDPWPYPLYSPRKSQGTAYNAYLSIGAFAEKENRESQSNQLPGFSDDSDN